MSTVYLIDLSAIYASCWFATVNGGDPTQARDLTVETIDNACRGKVAIICLDSATSWRRDLYPEYKAQRAPKPPEFHSMLDAAKAALAARGYQLALAEGCEADDVIATLAVRFRAAGQRVVIGGVDKDLYCLLCEQVTMLSTRDGKTIDVAACVEKFGVEPSQMVDYLCFVGDTSDNVPGVKGIGPKKAADLLSHYGSVDNVYGAMERGEDVGKQIGYPAATRALAESWPTVEMARKLIKLRKDAPVIFTGEPSDAAVFAHSSLAKEERICAVPAMVAAPVEAAKEERVKMALPAKQAAASRLANVKRGKVAAAWKFLFYGDAGVGKTTLAAGAPDPIWIDVEASSSHLDVPRYPFSDGDMGHVPTDYDQVVAAIDDLATSDHSFKTVVIDGLDKLEGLIWSDLVAKANRADIVTIDDFGYGKGFNAALDQWAKLLRRLDSVRARGVNVILVGHAHIKAFKNPVGEDFDMWQLRCNEKAAGALKDWADVCGFVAFDEWSKKDKGASRAKGYSSGKRVLYTEKTAAYYAKSRLPLAKEIPIDIANPWAPIAAAIAEINSANPTDLLAAIEAELTRIGDEELTGTVRGACEPVKADVPALTRYLNSLKGRPSKAEQVQAA